MSDSELHSRQKIRRVSVKIDKYRGTHQRGSSVNSRNSRQSSFMEEMATHQEILCQPSERL